MTIKSAIILAFGRNRITISKKALKMIGDPKFIILLVNPEERTLVILCSDETERRAHRIIPSKRRTELYSKVLLKCMFRLRDNWRIDYSYSIDGEVYSDEGMMRFNIDNAVLSSEVKE